MVEQAQLIWEAAEPCPLSVIWGLPCSLSESQPFCSSQTLGRKDRTRPAFGGNVFLILIPFYQIHEKDYLENGQVQWCVMPITFAFNCSELMGWPSWEDMGRAGAARALLFILTIPFGVAYARALEIPVQCFPLQVGGNREEPHFPELLGRCEAVTDFILVSTLGSRCYSPYFTHRETKAHGSHLPCSGSHSPQCGA